MATAESLVEELSEEAGGELKEINSQVVFYSTFSHLENIPNSIHFSQIPGLSPYKHAHC